MSAHAAAQPNPLLTYAITAVVIGVVFAFRWRRMRRPRPLKLERLWIFPAVLAAATAWLFATTPPAGTGWLFCLGALGAGAALGWQRGKLMRIAVDPDTHALNQTGSPAALLFLLAIVLLRSGARYALADSTVLHLSAAAITDMLLAFALGLFATTRLEMYLRTKRLLAAAAGLRGQS